MSTPDWLSHVQFVTFDCFGTLLDWRSAMERVELRSREDFDKLEVEVRKLQEQDQYLRYTEVLKTAIGRVRPQLRPAIIGLFADDFGRVAPFADSLRGLQLMRDVVKVGIVANCDAQHALDASATLRMAWDVCLTAQELRAYKPTDRAWDAVLRMGVARSAATRDNWLHVSTSAHADLMPARARGLRTCLLRRPGGDERATVDLTVDGLDELARLLAAAKAGPVVLEFDSATDNGTRDRLRAWLLAERLPQMRAVPGVRSVTLVERDDGTLVEHYVFGGKPDLDGYLEAFAPEHRAAVRDEFGSAVQRTMRLAQVRGRA